MKRHTKPSKDKSGHKTAPKATKRPSGPNTEAHQTQSPVQLVNKARQSLKMCAAYDKKIDQIADQFGSVDDLVISRFALFSSHIDSFEGVVLQEARKVLSTGPKKLHQDEACATATIQRGRLSIYRVSLLKTTLTDKPAAVAGKLVKVYGGRIISSLDHLIEAPFTFQFLPPIYHNRFLGFLSFYPITPVEERQKPDAQTLYGIEQSPFGWVHQGWYPILSKWEKLVMDSGKVLHWSIQIPTKIVLLYVPEPKKPSAREAVPRNRIVEEEEMNEVPNFMGAIGHENIEDDTDSDDDFNVDEFFDSDDDRFDDLNHEDSRAGIVVHPINGNIYICDRYNGNKVRVYSHTGEPLITLQLLDRHRRLDISGIAISPDGKYLAILNRWDEWLYILDMTYTFVRAFLASDNPLTGFKQVSGISFDLDNNIYASENTKHRVTKYSLEGTLLWNFTKHALVRGASSVHVSANNSVWVTCPLDDCIKVLDSEGRVLNTIKKAGLFGRGATSVTRGPDESMIVTICEDCIARIYNKSGVKLGELEAKNPSGAAYDLDGNLLILQKRGEMVQRYIEGR